jgi:nucleoside triphosphate diphosphatase
MEETQRLLSLMRRLRDPEAGCPWDRAQSFQSLSRYVLEEAYEVVDAVASGDVHHLREELGDLLFQVVFYATIADEQNLFDFKDVASGLHDKLVHRHPHVFHPEISDTASPLAERWEAQKERERLDHKGASSVLDGVTKAQPALSRAHALQRRAARIGFDWNEREGVLDKIAEEVSELRIAASGCKENEVREELGDFLFSAVNLARHLGVDPETSLREANDKFERRFRAVEERIRAQGHEPRETNMAELEAHWQAVKRIERE